MQLYVHLTHKHATLAFERLKNCLDDVRKWLSVNKLKLNPDKTEFILFGSKNVRTKLGKFFPVNILGTLLSPAEAIRNLAVWFDSDFSFSCHVRNICKACFVHIRDLRRLREYLTREAALLAANALVGSRLDYCNSLFRSLSALGLRRLQCVQNSLARIVANTTKYSHITPVRKSLHWLPRGHGGRVVTLSPPTSEVGGSIPVTALSGKAGSCLPLVGSLQYTTLANSMYWFPLPFQLPVVI